MMQNCINGIKGTNNEQNYKEIINAPKEIKNSSSFAPPQYLRGFFSELYDLLKVLSFNFRPRSSDTRSKIIFKNGKNIFILKIKKDK